jgi:hypothetical protein
MSQLLPTAEHIEAMASFTDFGEVAEHLTRVIKDSVTHGRAGAVTVKFKAGFNKDSCHHEVTRTITSKRPVDDYRNEEVMGHEVMVFRLGNDLPGQLRIIP